MAGGIGLKLCGMVKAHGRERPHKGIFESVIVDWVQVGGPRVPLLGNGNNEDTPNRSAMLGVCCSATSACNQHATPLLD